MSCLGQKDSTKNKHQVFLSFNVGLPLYDHFDYYVQQRSLLTDGKSKRKPSFNFSLEHNIKHFTINVLLNYSLNEFNGEPYNTDVKYLYSNYNNLMGYKSFEVYQTVKYNYLQAGIGIGYNHWIKKHNIALTTNLQKNIYTNVKLSTNYTNNPTYNNQDTSQVVLPKNFKPTDIKSDRDLYLNMKLTYTYALLKKLHLSLSFNASYGLLNTYSLSALNSGRQYENSFGYSIYTQKLIFGAIGVRYKLF